MTSLRKRRSRPSMCAGSLETSIEPTTVSVTPEAGLLAGGRTSTPPFPAGHSPANADPAASIAVSAIAPPPSFAARDHLLSDDGRIAIVNTPGLWACAPEKR